MWCPDVLRLAAGRRRRILLSDGRLGNLLSVRGTTRMRVAFFTPQADQDHPTGEHHYTRRLNEMAEFAGDCPDGAACGHECPADGCWRVLTCGPLSGVFPGDVWPDSIVAGTVAATFGGHEAAQR